ncbi:hypothetical protein Syun_027968 [Stephania yunnanensis]|uniref:Reverse transcriptase Ty1/copia-type domain-containing protein n=1 Tax=Stephania yunnanensis TaxID=152371 RepID=A0AAP0HQE9_9MAGN
MTSGSSFIALLVYVDDVVLASDNVDLIQEVKDFLHNSFQIKDLGEVKFFLGFEIARSSSGIHWGQRKYILDLLRDACFINCRPVSAPMVANLRQANVMVILFLTLHLVEYWWANSCTYATLDQIFHLLSNKFLNFWIILLLNIYRQLMEFLDTSKVNLDKSNFMEIKETTNCFSFLI